MFLDGEMTMKELNEQYSSRVQAVLPVAICRGYPAGVTVKAFEDALYSLEEGEISEPIRTQFGLHHHLP